jgi:ArsR family transcriptional regulator
MLCCAWSDGVSALSTAALPDLFRSLADPTRLRLLHALTVGEYSVGELADVLGLAQSGVSRHLAVLKQSGLVRDRREGASSFFSVPAQPEEERARALWPTVKTWLDALPEAAADRSRLEKARTHRHVRDFFQEVAPHYDSMRAAQYGDELRHLALLELLPRDLVVLDVGTGTGFMLLGVAQRVDSFIGVDASEAMLAQARENLAAAGRADADLRQGTMEALPVDGGSVDVVLANMALHHAARPVDALKEMARVLRQGGRVALTDLARHPHEWTREELADTWPGFTPDELSDGLRDAGLSQASVRRVGTCTLARARTREKHAVDVLLATATKTTSTRTPATTNRRKTRPAARAERTRPASRGHR